MITLNTGSKWAKQPSSKYLRLSDLPVILQRLGVQNEAEMAGWTPEIVHHQAGWWYPIFGLDTEQPARYPGTYQIAGRWTNANPRQQGGIKRCWLPEPPVGSPAYYVLPGTRAAIAQANGLCYIAADELNVLAYRSAGLLNVMSSLHGKTNIPQDLVQTAHQLGIGQLRYWMDNDQTGETSAQLTALALEGSDIIFSAYRLPAVVGYHGDVNQLWMDCQFDRIWFSEEILRIQADSKAVIETRMGAVL